VAAPEGASDSCSSSVVAPGAFYGTAGERQVRVALTGTDERVDAAVKRLQE